MAHTFQPASAIESTARISVRLSPQAHNAAKAVAKQAGLTLMEWVESLILHNLSQTTKEKRKP